jgi:hypothetical protein
MVVSCFTCSSNLKIQAIFSCETSIEFHETTRRYIPEDNTS